MQRVGLADHLPEPAIVSSKKEEVRTRQISKRVARYGFIFCMTKIKGNVSMVSYSEGG